MALEQRVMAGDLNVAYEVAGEGPTLVLAHGGLGDRRTWRPQIAALRDRYTVIAYDLRGHGATRSATVHDAYPPRLLADDLLNLADALELERFSLAGMSLGGMLAQELAIAHPHRLRALVLSDSWAVTGLEPRERRLGEILSPLVIGGLRLVGTWPLGALARLGLPEHRVEERRLVQQAVAGTDREDAVRVLRGLPAHDTMERLAGISTPTLLVMGERDRNLGQARTMRERIPAARLEVLSGAGHNSHLQQPERWGRAVGGFLDEVHARV